MPTARSMSEGGRTRLAGFLALVATLALAVVSPALASTTFVTVDDTAPAVEEVDGGGYKLSVGLTNITDGPVDVIVDATSPKLTDGCTITVGSAANASVPAASHDEVVLKFDAGCTAQDVNSVVLGAGPEATQKIELKPKNPEKAKPDWDQLWAFVIALGVAAFLVLALGIIWNVSPVKELVNLPDTWKFSDSLVTNVTLLGAALTGVVGSSDVVKAFLGKDADASIALATVGATVAAVIIGLGAVVLQTARRDGHFTVGGLLAAAAVTLSGAYGELFVVWQNGEELALGGWQDRLVPIVVILAALLLAYAVVSLKETIEQGLVAPKPDPLKLSADAIVATVIASKLIGDTEPADLAKQIRAALRAEEARQTTELTAARERATPKARISGISITPKPQLVSKSALL